MSKNVKFESLGNDTLAILESMPCNWVLYVCERDDKNIRWSCRNFDQPIYDILEGFEEVFYGDTAHEAVCKAWEYLNTEK